jgi:DNA-binding transcriptional LysR family regulator
VNIRKLDLNLLVVFDVLMQTCSVSKAADKLSLTQPAVSNALRRLRTQLNDPLLVRTQHGMRPTERALFLIEPIRRALSEIELNINPQPVFEPASSKQHFIAGTTDYLTQTLLPILLPKLRVLAPGVTLEIRNLGKLSMEESLESGEIDLAIGRFFDVSNRLERAIWFSEPLCCLLKKNHPLIKKKLDLNKFLALEHIWVSNSSRKGMIDHWLTERGYERQIVLTVPNYNPAAQLVAESELAVVLPESFGRRYSEFLPLKCWPLPMELGLVNIELIWHPLHGDKQPIKWLRQLILQLDI